MNADLFHSGTRPAVDVGLSVSRVGGAAQLKAVKQVAGPLRIDLAQYQALAAYAKLSADELDAVSRAQLARGDRVTAVLNQRQYMPMPVEHQVAILFAVTKGHMDDIEVADVPRFEEEFHKFMDASHADLLRKIRETGKLDDETSDQLTKAIADFKQGFTPTPKE